MALSADLLAMLRCPACVRQSDTAGLLTLIQDAWLVCQTCDRKYPIHDDIPVMLIDEGTRWQHTALAELPIAVSR